MCQVAPTHAHWLAADLAPAPSFQRTLATGQPHQLWASTEALLGVADTAAEWPNKYPHARRTDANLENFKLAMVASSGTAKGRKVCHSWFARRR